MTTPVEHINGVTFHGRHGAIKNQFRYTIDYVCVDPEADQTSPWMFKRNRSGFVSVWDRDHGGPPKSGVGAAWARSVFAEYGFPTDGRLLLLAQPRVLGHVFNPVSFWLCYDGQDRLCAVIAEVTNTFGDRHSYLCAKEDQSEITAQDRIIAEKVFHVSPFQKIEGGYEFRFDIRDDRIGIWIDYSAGNGGVIATLTGNRAPATNVGLLKAMLRRPFGSRRVLALIHWQAFKLWWKGATYRARPEPPKSEVSR